MNSIRQRIPNYCTGIDPAIVEFDTLEELMNIRFVQFWKNKDGFDHFAKSRDLLMVVLKNSFWVIGYIKNPKDVDLPKWNAKPKKIEKSKHGYYIIGS